MTTVFPNSCHGVDTNIVVAKICWAQIRFEVVSQNPSLTSRVQICELWLEFKTNMNCTWIILYYQIILGPGSLRPIIHLLHTCIYLSHVEPHKSYTFKKLSFRSPANPLKFGTQQATLWTRKLDNPQLVRCSLRTAATAKVGMKDGCPPTNFRKFNKLDIGGSMIECLAFHVTCLFRKMQCYIFAKKTCQFPPPMQTQQKPNKVAPDSLDTFFRSQCDQPWNY